MAISGVVDFAASAGRPLRLELHAAPPREGRHQGPLHLHSLSALGMLIESDQPLKFGDKIETAFSEAAVALREITWTGAKLFGSEFDDSVSGELLAQAVSRVRPKEQAETGSLPQTVEPLAPSSSG